MMRRAAATMPRAASAGSAQPANGRHGAVGGLSAASELGVRADSDSIGSARQVSLAHWANSVGSERWAGGNHVMRGELGDRLGDGLYSVRPKKKHISMQHYTSYPQLIFFPFETQSSLRFKL